MTQDHRKRILDHQERVAAEQRDARQPSDPQMKMPLISEVRRPDPVPPKRSRQRVKKPSQNQPQLRDV
jgi:hypothetical protein